MASELNPPDLRALLEQERADLRSQLADLGAGEDGDGLSYDSGFADSSQVTAERGETEALVSKLKEALADCEHALEKFESGTYGICENCGKAIAPARLEAMPSARLCIDCSAKARR